MNVVKWMLSAMFVCLPLLALEPTLPARGLQFKMDFVLFDADEYLDRDKISTPISTLSPYRDFEARGAKLALNYGWADGLTLISETTWRDQELQGDSGSLSSAGFTGVYLAMRQRLSQTGDGTRIMAETGIWYPAQADHEEPFALGYDALNWVFIASYNQDFFPTTGGFEMDLGYRFRNEAPDDEYFFDTALKLNIPLLGFLRVDYHVVESKSRSAQDYAVNAYPLDRGNQTLGLGVERDFGRLSLRLGFETVVAGRNQFDHSGLRFGFSWLRRGMRRR